MTGKSPSAYGTTTDDPDDWSHRAACAEADPELFWPIGNTPSAQHQAEEAKGWCADCPVRPECLEAALARGETDGVWGGLTGAELSMERRRRARRARHEQPTHAAVPEPAAPVKPPRNRALVVPAEDTRHMIGVLREAGKSWRQIGHLLGTSDSTCRDVYAGTRVNVARAPEENARSLSRLVHA